MKRFDVIVIGAGPGGQVAATRAAQLGFSTACIDEWKDSTGKPAPGGTCTNVGCIPAKALLQSSEDFEQVSHRLGEHGITAGGVTLDLARMLGRKDAVVKKNNDGILYLFRKNKIEFFHGRGTFLRAVDGGYELSFKGAANEVIVGKHVIVATGSNARPLPTMPFDEETVLSNDGALRIPAVPKRLGIIGSGVVGLELGSVWRRLGADVTILEALPVLLGAADEAVAKEAKKQLEKQGLKFHLGVKVESVTKHSGGLSIAYTSAQGESATLEVDKLIVSIGRTPNTIGLGAEVVGLELDGRGAIVVDEHCRTNLPNVWAIGDVVRGPMLAHKAEEEGSAVAERIAGQKPEVNFNTVPWVIYTYPELAWVGQTEQQVRESGRSYRTGTFPFLANGRARAMGETIGFVKIIADEKSDAVLGVHIVGPMASELIAEGVMAMEFGATSEDIALICHAHPTLSEAMKEAALDVGKRALNF
jgi:dihydrolipoamide dehydrogenase